MGYVVILLVEPGDGVVCYQVAAAAGVAAVNLRGDG